MSARTCLHCGKTLVRIRVGAGGDFCSREHRNQYQLRRGMDCLAQANKVATLARRRETPKALFGEASGEPASAARRAFPDAPPFRLLAGLSPDVKPPRQSGRVTLFPLAAALSEAVPRAVPHDVRREFGMKLAVSASMAIPHGPSAVWKPAGLGGKAARRLRGIAVAAAPGNALRVSSSAGFRLKAPQSPKAALAALSEDCGMAGIAARAGSLPFTLRQERRGAATDDRLAFVEMKFSSAPDAPARLDWLSADGATAIGRERREL
jgi:hypothetical protein